MDAVNTHVPLDRSVEDSSSDSSSEDENGARPGNIPGLRAATNTSEMSLFNPAHTSRTTSNYSAPGYVNPAPDFVEELYEARMKTKGEQAQELASKLEKQIAPGTLDRLFNGAESNDVAVLKELIDAGMSNLHIPRTKDMRTPLMIAVLNGHVDAVRLLIAHAKPEHLNHRDAAGASALDLALDNATVALAESVYKAAPGIRDDKGYTPLVAAIAYDKEVRIRRLLKFLPNVNERSTNDESALEMAIEKGMGRLVIKLLDKGAFVNERDRARNDPLSFAARFGYGDIVALLCTRGAVVDRQNKDGNTALQFAAWMGHQLAAKRLLQHGAQPNLQDNAGVTPLGAAAACGHANIVALLVKHGAAVDLADIEGHTPLHMAALAGHASAVEALIRAGASIDAVDKFGRTPLQYAVEKNRAACVRLLLAHRADFNHADSEGHTALDICDDHGGVEEIGEVLREYGARGKCCRACVIV